MNHVASGVWEYRLGIIRSQAFFPDKNILNLMQFFPHAHRSMETCRVESCDQRAGACADRAKTNSLSDESLLIPPQRNTHLDFHPEFCMANRTAWVCDRRAIGAAIKCTNVKAFAGRVLFGSHRRSTRTILSSETAHKHHHLHSPTPRQPAQSWLCTL